MYKYSGHPEGGLNVDSGVDKDLLIHGSSDNPIAGYRNSIGRKKEPGVFKFAYEWSLLFDG